MGGGQRESKYLQFAERTMFPQLSGAMGEAEDSSMVTILEDNSDMGAFVIHHFISRAVKKNQKLLLVGLEQSFGHFHSVGLKLGFNLLKLREQKSVLFYEGLKRAMELGLSSSGPLSGGDSSDILEDNNSLEKLYNEVVAASSANCQMVVIDNLSILHCLGHNPAAVFAFLHNLRLHLKSLGITLVVRLTQLPSDIGWVRMSKLATLRAGVTIQVEPLATGQSR